MRQRNSVKNQVTNVRVVDDYAGTDAAYIDRCLGDLQNSHSQITMLIQTQVPITPSSGSGQNNFYSATLIRASDDLASVSAQFQTYRIRAIRFDVYDINPSLSTANVWSTFHDVLSSTPSAFTFDQVTDGPDSQTIPPGSGKVSFYWRAKGTTENEFQSLSASSSGGAPPFDFGGLRVALGAATTSTPKYQLIVKALVDLRGRT
jgi:hypothetical protein